MSGRNPDLQRAIEALRQARRKIEALEREHPEQAIAVTGMACRFPGCDDVDELWRLLADGRDAIVEVPPDRWAIDRTQSRHGGFVADALAFEPERFAIAQAEAEAMDPQQRMLLEVAAAAFERAGDAELDGSNTGVFVGISTHDYAQRSLRDEAPEAITPYTGTGNAFCTAAGRIAYVFGLEGPCLALDTACSSTLVAAHLACESLRSGECDRALVAGVNVLLAPAMTVYFSRLGVLAPDAFVRSFAADAHGYVRAEGCGALVLRRRGDAERDGDPIVGLIRGSAVNQNGRGNGLTAPSRRAQVRVIRRALARAGVAPAEVGYVEAFGSATPQGDAVELRALAEVFGPRDPSAGPLPLASVKSNIGHAEAASGAASLIKALLCVDRGELPASLNCDEPNPALAQARDSLRIVRAREPWPDGRPRIVGVSGFGFGGTNAHVIVEAAPRIQSSTPTEAEREPQLIVLTARSPSALERRRAALLDQLERAPATSLDMLARGCAAVRHHAHRLAFVCTDLDGARVALRDGDGDGNGNGVGKGNGVAVAVHIGEVERPAPAGLDGLDAGLNTDRRGALDALAARFVRGHAPPWSRILEPGPRVSLPPHPSDRRALADIPVMPLGGARAPAPARAILGELLELPLARRRERLEVWLGERLASVAGRPVEPAAALVELGLDSLAVIGAIQAIQRELELQIYPQELLGGSLASFAELLARQLGERHVGAREPASAPGHRRAAAIAHVAAHWSGSPLARQLGERLPGAVLVLGAPRCGSTLLRAMLAGHPRLFAPPELHLLGHADMASWHRALGPKMMHLGLGQALIGLGLAPDDATARVDAWVADATPTAAVYAELQALAGDRLLVDKSPSHALEPETLARAEALFDAPRYLILTRHPYATIESFARLRMQGLFDADDHDPHLVAEAIWRRAYANLDTLARDRPQRCHRIAFEQLVADPEPALRRVCTFLGLEFDPALLDPFAGDRMLGGDDRAIGFIGDPNFGSRSRIDPSLGDRWKDVRLPWRLDADTVALARSLGYPTPVEAPEPAHAPEPPPEPASDAILEASFSVAPARPPAATDELLLTGATGFLGVQLAAELLARHDVPLRCLVRAATPEAATERVRAAMIDHGVWRPEWRERLRGEPADLAAPGLGLAPARWDALAEQVRAIWHNGAVVSFGLPYAALRGANVEGTAAILRLAAAVRRKPVHFVSTKGVFTTDAYPGAARIDEDAPVREPTGGLAYQRSKWAGERLVLAAGERGLETAVYRPGRIGGHSRTGRINPDDLLCRILRTCVAVGALPDIDLRVEVTPVDHVAAAIVRIASKPGATGRAYNLAHTAPISMAELRDALADAGVELELQAWHRWRRAALADPDGPLAPVAALLRERAPERIDEARLDASNTRTLDGEWSPPPVVEQLLRDLAFMRDAGLLEGEHR